MISLRFSKRCLTEKEIAAGLGIHAAWKKLSIKLILSCYTEAKKRRFSAAVNLLKRVTKYFTGSTLLLALGLLGAVSSPKMRLSTLFIAIRAVLPCLNVVPR